MRNVISIVALAIGLFFASCEKKLFEIDEISTTESIEVRSSTENVSVTVAESNLNGGDLTVVFSGFETVENIELADEQTLNFSGANGVVSFNCSVVGYTSVGENLSVIFNVSGFNLSGLEIDVIQNIIIVEGSVE